MERNLAMARRIAKKIANEPDGAYSNEVYLGALAAIIETSERIERMLDKCNDPCPQCWEAFSKGDHLDD